MVARARLVQKLLRLQHTHLFPIRMGGGSLESHAKSEVEREERGSRSGKQRATLILPPLPIAMLHSLSNNI